MHASMQGRPSADSRSSSVQAGLRYLQQGFERLVDQACSMHEHYTSSSNADIPCRKQAGPSENNHAASADHEPDQSEQQRKVKDCQDPRDAGLKPSSGHRDVDGEHEASQCLVAMRELACWPVSLELLRQSTAGRRIRLVKKNGSPSQSAAASEVIKSWKCSLGA